MRALVVLWLVMWVSATAAAEPAQIGGRLVGRPFAPKKVIFVDGTDYQQLHFIDDAGGAPCDQRPGARSVQISSVTSTRAKPILDAGKTLTLETGNVVVVHSKPDLSARPKDVRLAVTIDAVDGTRGVARGRIDWAADDDSALAGPFEATYCGSKVKVAGAAPSANGLAWKRDPVPARAIPAAAASGVVAGNLFKPAFANVIAYESISRREWYFREELNFFATEPATPCTDSARAASDGFTVLFKSDRVVAGPVKESARPIVKWREPGVSYLTIDDSHAANLTLVFENVDRRRRQVTGRIYLAVDDPGKSMLVGSFTARYCSEPR